MQTSDGITQKQYEDLCSKIRCIIEKLAVELENDKDILAFLIGSPIPNGEGSSVNDKRIYYLLLNRLKTWVAREQSKKDGGQHWKKKFKKNPIGICKICSKKFTPDDEIEFHHTLRDGRGPIPLHKECHTTVKV